MSPLTISPRAAKTKKKNKNKKTKKKTKPKTADYMLDQLFLFRRG